MTLLDWVLLCTGFVIYSFILFSLGVHLGVTEQVKAQQAKESTESDEEYMTPCEEEGHDLRGMVPGREVTYGAGHYCTKCGITLYDIWEERKRKVRQ